VKKLIGPADKVMEKIFAIGNDKKERANLSLADAKKEIKAFMPEIQKMDDAATEFLGSLAAACKEA